MRRAAATLVVWASLAPVWAAPTLAQRIHHAIDSSPAARSAFWGIQIIDQASGATLFQWNADHFFVPASNTKLFSTALALKRLGPDYKFRTTVRMDADGSIRLVGGGDPNLSNRVIPYQKGEGTGDPLQAIEDLADRVVACGITRIAGDVVGDDSAYVWQPYPPGWALDDPTWDYGAPVSALTVNDNMFSLTVTGGERDGDPASIQLSPAVEFYQIDNRVRTDSTAFRRTSVGRGPGSMQLQLWGKLAPGQSETRTLGIDDPALYAARAFYDALTRRSVNIMGRPVARHLYPDEVPDLRLGQEPEPPAGTEIAARDSAPLVEDLRITDKVSHNLHAEMLLRAVARARRNVGSRQAGMEEMKAFLTEAELDEEDYHFEDGSGLSRLNLVRPRAVVQLLRYMYSTPQWMDLLPTGGEDGTLATRFTGTRAAGKIHAKTGTLSHVSTLSGYAVRRSGAIRTFSIMVNNYAADGSEIRAIVDKICNLIVE
jgi:D-alanyl-D-alanine carboxypeptidase/D-alanyl-D-alanine-endopeptidase (penicillin-binding protein 4)